MKKHIHLLSLVILSMLLVSPIYSQDWIKQWQDPNVNFYDIQKSFNSYWAKRLPSEKEKRREAAKGIVEDDNEKEMEGYAQFKRWEYFMAPRVYPSGKLDPTATYNAYQKYISHSSTERSAMPTWKLIGPTGIPINGGGAGRVNCVRFNGTTTYAGSPAGGLWKSVNGGTWTTNTDQLASLGVSDIVIDPSNKQIMYLATGDGDMYGSTYSIGVLKSTDGGATWNTTGLNWATSSVHKICKMVINPINSKTIFAATDLGVYRTLNAGATWAMVSSGNIRDLEMKPGDTTIVYACSNVFFRSTNGGASFTTVGIPTTIAVERLAIAVTAADPTYVYVVASDNSYGANQSGFVGLYRSTNSGANFVSRSTSPNLLGWASAGNDQGGQGWYSLAIAASPTNKDFIVVGGVNIRKSTDGGANWALNSHWYGSGAPYVHADIHDLVFTDGTTYYAGCDGGVFKATNSGSTWTDLSNGLQLGQIYSIGLSANNPSLHISGWQDNGSSLYNGTSWNRVIGGDGMVGFIDWSNNNYIYGETTTGGFKRSSDGGANFTDIKNGITESSAWVTPWGQDPQTSTTLYGGFVNMFKSTDRGNNWSKIGSLTGTGNVVDFSVAPSNSNYIYAVKSSQVFRTTNGGTTWTDVTGTLPVANASITKVVVKYNNFNKLWITFSGFSSGNKVFTSSDAGATWTNISAGLPNIPANAIVPDNLGAANDAIYVGTDVGVYYRDNNSGGFVPYMDGLPNVIIDDLKIYYPTKKLRAATFGRSLWEADLYSPAVFTASQTSGCPGLTVQYTDQTNGSPTSWKWKLPGGTPPAATVQNPLVTYNTPGQYNATLVATNINGSDSVIQNNYITVYAVPATPSIVNDARCGAGIVNLTATGSGGTLNWYDASSAGVLVNTGGSYSPNITGNTTYYVEEAAAAKPIQNVGQVDSALSSTGAFFPANTTHGLLFDVLKPIRLKTVTVYTDIAGNRTIELLNAIGGAVLQSKVVNIPVGKSKVTLNFDIPAGSQYFIKVTGTLNNLYRNGGKASYPYNLAGLVSITETDLAPGQTKFYYFFYNWEVQEQSCSSARAPVTGTTNVCTGINDPDAAITGISIFPNPTSGIFETKFELVKAGHISIEIYSVLGEKVYSWQEEAVGSYTKQIDISKVSSGIYTLHITAGDKERYSKLIKER